MMRFLPDEIARTSLRQALWLTAAVWALDVAFNALPVVVAGRASAGVWVSIGLIAAIGALLSLGVFGLLSRLRQRRPAVRYGALLVVALACGAATSSADLTIGGVLRSVVEPGAAALSADQRLIRGLTNVLGLSWMFGLLGALYLMLQANHAMIERERQLAEARAAAAEAEAAATAARLAALRYQLNPHFLFNTLNAVSSAVITARNAEAESMLEKLAEFLRVTLAADPAGLIPLEDELATIQAYLEIESVRFRDRLGVDFACPDDLRGAVVPSFILQPLIENAVKHGVSRATGAVVIRLEVTRDGDDLVLLVEDDAQRVGEPARGGGLGLRNVRQRLDALYGARGVLQTTARERGFLALVRLPLRWTTRPQVVEAA